MLNQAIGLAYYRPDIDLGNSFDQVAMSHILTNDMGYELDQQDLEFPEESERERAKRLSQFTRPALFQPRTWYNAYQFKHGYEEDPSTGNLLVHFPGLGKDRWNLMDELLGKISQQSSAWNVPYENSVYASAVPKYWQLVREARTLVRTANETLADSRLFGNRQARLREYANICESPLTNSSYSIGPGQDLLAHMQDGITWLHGVLEEYSEDFPTSDHAQKDVSDRHEDDVESRP